MIEVDRLMTDVLEIQLIQMMENAGRNLARLCVQRFLDDPDSKKVVVLTNGAQRSKFSPPNPMKTFPVFPPINWEFYGDWGSTFRTLTFRMKQTFPTRFWTE